jgi:alanine racemase
LRPLAEVARVQEPSGATRPTAAVVRLAAVAANYHLIRSLVQPAEVYAVVKANAYGHGAVPVARRLESEGCHRFAVGTLEEGIELRSAGIASEVLLLQGASAAQFRELLAHRLVPVASCLSCLAALGETGRGETLSIHVKFDTGMGRVGLLPQEVGAFCDLLRRQPHLKLAGVATHLARAGESRETTLGQLLLFEEILAALRDAGMETGLAHAANSAACFDEPASHFDAVRVGLALYGALPEPGLLHAERLQPALSWVSAVSHVREVPPGTPVSYGGTFVTARPTLLGIVPVGYGDGYRRALGNRGQALVRGHRVPIVGRVCMDWAVLDLTGVPDAREGEEVVLIGRQGGEVLSVEHVASWLDTISYEVFCGIAARVPRRYEEAA